MFKRIVPKDKISEILKYGENSIKMIESKTYSMISKSKDEISTNKTSEYISRNEIFDYLQDEFIDKNNKDNQTSKDVKYTKRNNCTFGAKYNTSEEISKYIRKKTSYHSCPSTLYLYLQKHIFLKMLI